MFQRHIFHLARILLCSILVGVETTVYKLYLMILADPGRFEAMALPCLLLEYLRLDDIREN